MTVMGSPFDWPLNSSLLGILFCVVVSYCALKFTHRLFLHPLRRVPGPIIARSTNLWLTYHGFVGDECRVIRRLHDQYGPVVRIGPDDVDIADGEALWPIYMDKGGFEKPNYYTTFDLNGHASIFSSMRLGHRESRVKAVLPIFSLKSIRSAKDSIQACATKFVDRLEEIKGDGKPINIIDHTRAFALDAVTGYVFGQPYGALQEPAAAPCSAGACVDLFISDSMFFYFAPWLTSWIQRIAPHTFQSKRALASEAKVDKYLNEITDSPPKTSYESRLIERGFCRDEIFCQVKDALFAGTDSTGNSLAHFCWYLAKYPEKYEKLKQEVQNSKLDADADPLSLPYLNGCIRETLRLTHSISIRLPRVVPSSGWNHGGYHIPAGTKVGVAAYQLHLNPDVFEDPFEFRPERWTKDVTEQMQRDWLPFGKGARSCIARNLAQSELSIVAMEMVRRDLLKGATVTQAVIEKYEWFFSRIKGDKIELVWQ